MEAKMEEESPYRGRRVSDLASMFESKIREKVRSSPYLRHYKKFSEPPLHTWESCTEKFPPPEIKSMTLPVKINAVLLEGREVTDESPDSVFSENGDENDVGSSRMEQPDGIDKWHCNDVREKVEVVVSDEGVVKVGRPVVYNRELSMDVVNENYSAVTPRATTKLKRSKSLTSSFQKLLRRDKRLSSAEGEHQGVISEKVLGRGSDNVAGILASPKMRPSARRLSDESEKRDGSKKMARRMSRGLRGFFRTISLNNIVESKRNATFASSESCEKCRLNESMSRMVLPLERFNSLTDERDMLKSERDRAVEEWSQAASRWEQMLDDMDAMMSELIQVRCERDDKAVEIREVISDYEDELKIREGNYDSLRADHEDLADQLEVAKKERINALTEYDELLKHNYDISRKLEKVEDANMELHSCISVCEQDIAVLKQQVDNLHEERDQALELWNASVEERKKLHKEMAALIQSRDELLRKTFQQTEEINALRKDRDAFQRLADRRRENGHLELRDDEGRIVNGRRSHESSSPSRKKLDYLCEEALYHEADIPEFIEVAVSLERLDSKYGIRVDAAVDEPKIMVVHVGAHAASSSNIRKYDRIMSVNGVSVVRSDKKSMEKMIRDCPGRLTMVLQRENPAFKAGKSQTVDLLIPKNSHRHNQDLGLKCKVQVLSIDENSPIGGKDKIEAGDLITKINTQDISKVFEALLYKISKKQGGKLCMKLQKKMIPNEYSLQDDQMDNNEPKSYRGLTRSYSNVSQSSNQSIASNNSGHTYGTAYTDDNESLFSGSLTPSIVVYQCNEGEEEVSSLPGRLRKLSNQFQETDLKPEDDVVQNGHGQGVQSSHPRVGKRNADVRSFRSLKVASSARGGKQQLRRVRSDGPAVKEQFPSEEASSKPGRELLPVDEHDTEDRKHNSWLIPSPVHTPLEDRRGKNAVSVFATLPRQKKKTVNDADCNKRTTHRVLRLEKNEKEPLGFDVSGGNKVGIFVKEIQDGSMAALGGMKVGDRILYINSYDFHCATLDYATRIILKSEKLTNFRIEVKYEEKFKDMLKETPLDSLYVRTLRHCENSKEGNLQFGVGEILLVTNTLVNYSKINRASWQWYAQKVSRTSSGERGLIPRLESFSENDEHDGSIPGDIKEVVPNKATQSSHGKKAKRSASDVRRWLMKKPSINRKKKEKDIKERNSEIVGRSPYYEILWDN